MYHSIQIIPDEWDIVPETTGPNAGKFGGINTWDDWHLIPASRPVINPPAPKTYYIDIPGANGVIDATLALSNRKFPAYNNREASIEFYVVNGTGDEVNDIYQYAGRNVGYISYGEWQQRYSDILNFLHGRKVKVILEDDIAHYYVGRVSVNEWKSEKDYSKIALDFNLDPFKYDLFASNEDWLWDPFSFVNGVITNPGVIEIDDTFGLIEGRSNTYVLYAPIPDTPLPIVPTFYFKDESFNASSATKNYITVQRYNSNGVADITKTVVATAKDVKQRWHDFELVDSGSLGGGTTCRIVFTVSTNSHFKVAIAYRGGML